MTRALVLNVLSTKTIKFMLVSFAFFVLFAVAMPAPARAAILSSAQIESIVSLLNSFGADQSAIKKVTEALSDTSGSGGSSFPGADLAISSLDANSFVAHVKPGQWTNYTYQLDWGEGETNTSQGKRARLVTVCNSIWTCSSSLLDSWHDYVTPGYYDVYLYATKEGAGRTLVEAASVRAGEDSVASAAPVIQKFVAEPERPTVNLSATPTQVVTGERAQLVWSSKNATSCVLKTNGVTDKVNVQGARTVIPQETSIYELTCVNQDPSSEKDGPSASKEVTVSVGRVPAPTCRLIANKDRIEKGQSVTLTWVSANADYASQKGGGYGPAQGSITLKPDGSKTYVKTVYGKGGSAKCMVDVKVEGSSFNDRKETVYNTNNIVKQILAAVVSAPGNFIARLVTERADASEIKYRELKARNMASTTSNEHKGWKEAPQGLEKSKFPGGSACGFLMRNLKRGMSGDDVKQFQEYLRSTGDLEDEASGYFGVKTEQALKKIQERQNIVTSGSAETTGFGAAGPRTRTALMAHCKALKERRENGSATSTKPVSTIDKTVAPTCTLTSSKSEVTEGEEVTLTWVSTNATHASMPGGYKGPANGSLTIKVNDTTTFVKRVYNPGNEGSCTVAVAVTDSDDTAIEKIVQQTESTKEEPVVAQATSPVLDRVFDSVGQTLAAAITAYLGLFNIQL